MQDLEMLLRSSKLASSTKCMLQAVNVWKNANTLEYLKQQQQKILSTLRRECVNK